MLTVQGARLTIQTAFLRREQGAYSLRDYRREVARAIRQARCYSRVVYTAVNSIGWPDLQSR